MISAKSAGAVAVAVGVLCLAPTAIATDCGSRKEKAVGAYFKALVKCNKAEGHGVELDSNCHSGAKARLAKAFVNAEGAAGCAELGDVAEVSEDIELMYASIVSHIPKYRETCSGGVDDDGDGDVDCADDDCFNVEPCNTAATAWSRVPERIAMPETLGAQVAQ